MAKLIKKFASGKILSIEDFTFNLINPIKQNKSFINSDKFSQEFNSNDLLEFKSMLLDDLKINEGQIEEDKGENAEVLSILEKPKEFEKLQKVDNLQENNKNSSNTKTSSKYPAGIKTFNDAFDAVQIKIPEIKKYRKFLTELANRESSFRPDAAAKNTKGTALGYFQFMPFNRQGISPKDFVNNPELQIEMAWKLLKEFKNSFNSVDWAKARNKGYTESAMIAGAWLSGAGGVKRFLNTGYKAQDNLGTNVKNYMDKFNKLV